MSAYIKDTECLTKKIEKDNAAFNNVRLLKCTF